MLIRKLVYFQPLKSRVVKLKKQSFGKKKPSTENAKSKQKNSYNLDGIEISKLPPHLKKAYQVKQEAYRMQVPSQAELTDQLITQEIKRQRDQLLASKSKKGFIDQLDFLQKTSILLMLSNLSIAALLSMYSIKYLGIYTAMLLQPSLLALSAVILGTNIGYMVIRQGLCLHCPIQSLKSINLTEAPISYYFETLLVTYQLYLLCGLRNWSVVDSFVDPTISIGIISAGILGSVGHSYYQEKDLNKLGSWSINIKCLGIGMMGLLYILKEYSDKEQFHQGKLKYMEFWRAQKPKIKKGQKINE